MKEYETSVTVTNEERAETWKTVFGSTTIPVTSFIPKLAYIPSHDTPQPVYLLDLSKLDEKERQNLVTEISHRFDLDPIFVEEQLDQHGVPILASDCMAMTTDLGMLYNLID